MYEESDELHVIYSACAGCREFRAMCIDGDNGFGCKFVNEHFIPFGYYRMNSDGRKSAVDDYQHNRLPDECIFHTQCSMLNFFDDESECPDDGCEVKCIGLDVIKTALCDDSQALSWIDCHDCTAVAVEKDGVMHGMAVMAVDESDDYKWILPAPPSKNYLQKGTKAVVIRYLKTDGELQNATRMMLSEAYSKALDNGAEEICVVSGIHSRNDLSFNGFHSAGYVLGGAGDDDSQGMTVYIRKTEDELMK